VSAALHFRLRTIETTADGREIVRDKDLPGPELTIGRSPENAVHLPDLAVEPHHARLVAADGRVRVEALGTLGFTADGSSRRNASIDLATGAELRFGAYTIGVGQALDGAVLLTVRSAANKSDIAAPDEKRSFTLAGALPGKRVTSWLLALVVLAAFLAWPVYNALNRPANGTVKGDAAWSSGPLSLAHHGLEAKCEACHAKPFEPVQDKACLTCHKTVHDHAPGVRMAGAREAPGAGGQLLQRVAHAFGKPGPGACSDCHTEHEGAGAMPATPQKFCAGCHGTLAARLSDTKLGNAADFGSAHPQFRATVTRAPGNPTLTRVSLDGQPREANGLAFPHKLHLDQAGGARRMAASMGEAARLECGGCHRPTADGVRFLPIDMERDCESCHSLVYDRVGSTFRTLRHGDIEQMRADLAASDRRAEPIVTGRRRPGEFAASGRYFSRFSAPASGAARISQALSRDGVCGECHTPAVRDGRMSVTPVVQPERYMVNGWFDHRPHRQETCASCHAAHQSSSADDVLLPGVKTCRNCHLGEGAASADVPSSCAMCHSYHPTVAAPPKQGRRVAGLAG
jgi:predicted CXXCH cytochrome family protein